MHLLASRSWWSTYILSCAGVLDNIVCNVMEFEAEMFLKEMMDSNNNNVSDDNNNYDVNNNGISDERCEYLNKDHYFESIFMNGNDHLGDDNSYNKYDNREKGGNVSSSDSSDYISWRKSERSFYLFLSKVFNIDIDANNVFDQHNDDDDEEEEEEENDEDDDDEENEDMHYDANGYYYLSTRDDIQHKYNHHHHNSSSSKESTIPDSSNDNDNYDNNNLLNRYCSLLPKDLLSVFVQSLTGTKSCSIARNYVNHHLKAYKSKDTDDLCHHDQDHEQQYHHEQQHHQQQQQQQQQHSSYNSFQATRLRMPIVNEKYWSNNEHLKTSHYKTVFMKRTTVYILSNRLLELYSYQALIRCHLHTQDNLFTIRVIQILLYHYINYDAIVKKWLKCTQHDNKHYKHYSETISHDNDNNNKRWNNHRNYIFDKSVARNCLLYMMKRNINIERAIRIGSYLSAKNVDAMIPPITYYELHPMLTNLSGSSTQHTYLPV